MHNPKLGFLSLSVVAFVLVVVAVEVGMSRSLVVYVFTTRVLGADEASTLRWTLTYMEGPWSVSFQTVTPHNAAALSWHLSLLLYGTKVGWMRSMEVFLGGFHGSICFARSAKRKVVSQLRRGCHIADSLQQICGCSVADIFAFVAGSWNITATRKGTKKTMNSEQGKRTCKSWSMQHPRSTQTLHCFFLVEWFGDENKNSAWNAKLFLDSCPKARHWNHKVSNCEDGKTGETWI